MLIQLSGQTGELPADWSAKQLVTDLQLTGERIAIEVGREAFLAGRIARKRFASASSPIDGTIF